MAYPDPRQKQFSLDDFLLPIKELADANNILIQIENKSSNSYKPASDKAFLNKFLLILTRILGSMPVQSEIIISPGQSGNPSIRHWCSVECRGVEIRDKSILKKNLDIDITLRYTGSSTIIDFHLPEKECRVDGDGKNMKVDLRSSRKIHPFHLKFKSQIKKHISTAYTFQQDAQALNLQSGQFLKKVNDIIFANLGNPQFDGNALSKEMALSRQQLYRILKPLVRRPPAAYIRYLRLMFAKEKLENSNLSIGDISELSGYLDQSHFARAFKRQFGYPPSYYRNTNNQHYL